MVKSIQTDPRQRGLPRRCLRERDWVSPTEKVEGPIRANDVELDSRDGERPGALRGRGRRT